MHGESEVRTLGDVVKFFDLINKQSKDNARNLDKKLLLESVKNPAYKFHGKLTPQVDQEPTAYSQSMLGFWVEKKQQPWEENKDLVRRVKYKLGQG